MNTEQIYQARVEAIRLANMLNLPNEDTMKVAEIYYQFLTKGY